MAHDVFVSYSNRNKAVADAVCATLEAHGVRCWIAPRDVTPGREWGECIIDAIEGSRVMVLIFTADANASHQIRREVERAVNRGVVILPFRIEDVFPGRALEFFIGNVQWLDALTPPIEPHLRNLTESVKVLLARRWPANESAPEPALQRAATERPALASNAESEAAATPPDAPQEKQEGNQLDGPSRADATSQTSASRKNQLPPAGGAVPVDSPFYLVRPLDKRFEEALDGGDSLVSIKSAREMGKTSFLVRGLLYARRSGKSTVFVDLQRLPQSAFADIDCFWKAICKVIAGGLGIQRDPGDFWDPEFAAFDNVDRFLSREVLKKADRGVIIAIDEVDRLLPYPFAQDVFGLFRSWHNERAMDPDGPWRRLTMVLAYCTERNLLITDRNQSSFNVGTKIELSAFSFEQVERLNELYWRPVSSQDEMGRFHEMFAGQPYLTQLAFRELVQKGISVDELLSVADAEAGPFSDHLARLLELVNSNAVLVSAVQSMLQGKPVASAMDFYRLRSAGVITGQSSDRAQFACVLYRMYFARHLGLRGSFDAHEVDSKFFSSLDSSRRSARIQ
jgi:hypothetical protein